MRGTNMKQGLLEQLRDRFGKTTSDRRDRKGAGLFALPLRKFQAGPRISIRLFQRAEALGG